MIVAIFAHIFTFANFAFVLSFPANQINEVIFPRFRRDFKQTIPLCSDLFNNRLKSRWRWKSEPRAEPRQGGVGSDQIVGILTPASDISAATSGPGAASESYLPNLGFWADLGGLVLGRSPTLSPMVRLSRGIFESQQCAEFVSCEVSKLSRRHSPLQILHTFLLDFPFSGDLADRMKMGSTMGTREDGLCGFRCNPMEYLNRGVKTLSLLHAVADAANPIK